MSFIQKNLVFKHFIVVEVTCPSLRPTMSKLSYTCTDENKFRSICSYACAKGYDIKPGMSRVRVCTQYKFWRGSIPECTGMFQF